MVGLHWYMDMLQVKFDFRLNFFIETRLIHNFLCLLALIIHELGQGNKGNWESTWVASKLTWNQLWPVMYRHVSTP